MMRMSSHVSLSNVAVAVVASAFGSSSGCAQQKLSGFKSTAMTKTINAPPQALGRYYATTAVAGSRHKESETGAHNVQVLWSASLRAVSI